MQQFLKAAARSARAEVIASQLLDQFLVTVDDAVAALDVRLRGESPASFTRTLKSGGSRRGRFAISRYTLWLNDRRLPDGRASQCSTDMKRRRLGNRREKRGGGREE